MKHDELVKLLPFYAANSLEPQEKKLVEEGLASSPELRKELAFWQSARKVITAQTRYIAAGHLTSDQIVEYVEGVLRDERLTSNIESHMRECESCRSEVEMSRNAWNELAKQAKTSVGKEKNFLRIALERVVGFFNPFVLGGYSSGSRVLAVQPLRAVYAAVTLVFLVAISVVLLNRMTPPGELHQPFLLASQEIVRGAPAVEIPSVSLTKEITHLDIILTVNSAGISDMRYSIALGPDGEHAMPVEGIYRAARYDERYDTMRVAVSRTQIRMGNRNVIIAKELQPVSHPDLETRDFSFVFFVEEK